jgi:DNA-binding response OmpR family regulator
VSLRTTGPADPVRVRDAHAILVVDDNSRLCDLAKRALSEDGWTVHVASSRGAALGAAASETFALALSDYAMPGGNGVLLLSELQRLQPECCRVLWSAGLPASAASRARELGVRVLVGKPLGEELRAVVRALVPPERSLSRSAARGL